MENSTDENCIFLNDHPISILPQYAWNQKTYQVQIARLCTAKLSDYKTLLLCLDYILHLWLLSPTDSDHHSLLSDDIQTIKTGNLI